uniref:Transmembrane protein 254 n=1 Tax=Amphimedon queenslandica TaxID=400682 RepID=A0A1X7VQ93_AMPQE
MALTFRVSKWYSYLGVFVGLGLQHLVVFNPSVIPYDSLGPFGSFLHYLAYSQHRMMLIGYCIAWLVHAGEAAYAFILTRRHNLSVMDSFLWTLQTFLLGFSSLIPLKRILKKREQ